MVSKRIRIQHCTSMRIQLQAFSSHSTHKFLLSRFFSFKKIHRNYKTRRFKFLDSYSLQNLFFMGELFQMTWVFQNRNEMDPEIQILLNNLRVFNCMWMINVQCSWPRECRCTRGMGSMAAGQSNESPLASYLWYVLESQILNPQSISIQKQNFPSSRHSSSIQGHSTMITSKIIAYFTCVFSIPFHLIPKSWYGTLSIDMVP